jgi:hypothetical protein
MKKIYTCALVVLSMLAYFNGFGQENYGGALNIGIGVGGYSGYYGYVGRSLPVLHVDYELNVAKNFTLAPFLNFYRYSDNYYWGDKNYPARNYTYHETVVPIGVKGTYYFDDLLEANSKWDFYLAGSLGVAIVKQRWEDGYYGERNHYHHGGAAFLDLHIGAEYHFNNRLGAFLDLSSGVSTLGLAIH